MAVSINSINLAQTKNIHMETIKTFLPVFPGFYNTLYEFDDTGIVDLMEVPDIDFLDIDYQAYKTDVAKSFCEFIESEVDFIDKVTFENISSPREYNFYNDAINVEITLNIAELQKYLLDNFEALDEYLCNNYTSCSGFISHYSNTAKEWQEETNNFTRLDIDSHRLGALLSFYFDHENYTSEQIYYSVMDCIYTTDYCTVKEFSVDDLSTCDIKKILSQMIIHGEIDTSFGYASVLVSIAKEKSPDNLLEFITDNPDNEFLNHITEEIATDYKLGKLSIC